MTTFLNGFPATIKIYEALA